MKEDIFETTFKLRDCEDYREDFVKNRRDKNFRELKEEAICKNFMKMTNEEKKNFWTEITA